MINQQLEKVQKAARNYIQNSPSQNVPKSKRPPKLVNHPLSLLRSKRKVPNKICRLIYFMKFQADPTKFELYFLK